MAKHKIKVINNTLLPLVLGPDAFYFNSGGKSDDSGPSDPIWGESESEWEVEDGIAGTTGGNAWMVLIPHIKAKWGFAIGWRFPLVGADKAGVVESDSAEAGYDKATSNGNTITSSRAYEDADSGAEVKFGVSATMESNRAVFTVYYDLYAE